MRTTRNSGEIGANLAAASIVALGLILYCHYAIQTPVWQYPDEPAHYNYGFALASTGQLVEIKAGDWDLQSLPGAWDWPANSGSPAMSHGYLRSLFLGLTLVEVVYYNLTYIQAPGRYLFPALPAWLH